MPNLSHLTWATAPTLICVLLLAPPIALTALALLAACVALFGPKGRCSSAIRLVEIAVDALLRLMCAVLRSGQPPQGPIQRRSRGRR
ncbi:hypothetical protein IU494_30345 [Nocardia terpenica]|uniref:hypothetical protein n=1 Tax=Nocardia terpenica TaxID=455432 RepID=UPI0018947E8A|nr:hypothetical protein [Nocardia terpenica]MBF6064949.1 hypothetical protein [Nocardia terpenica]MBF6115221.1 hypothetical protein [Nocardia terpenica]MBF6122543.1 hypothetical protein [Nocardia terpenica]